jgi:hypothetical protein
MAESLSHLAWPYEMGVDVQQDTIAERQQSAAVAVCTPKGAWVDNPDFGTTVPLFESRPLDTHRLAQDLAQSDPRLAPTVDEVLALADATRAVLRADVRGA